MTSKRLLNGRSQDDAHPQRNGKRRKPTVSRTVGAIAPTCAYSGCSSSGAVDWPPCGRIPGFQTLDELQLELLEQAGQDPDNATDHEAWPRSRSSPAR
jgi:hypothetical protein